VKTLILNLWAWVLVHPVEVVGAFVSALGAMIAAATAINPKLKGPAIGWLSRFVDALALRTRQGAANGPWSWPLVGRSIFEAAVAASMPAPEEPPPPSAPGFAERGALAVVAGVALLALGASLLSGCAAASNPMLSPIAPRIIERPEYGTCIETGGKLRVPDGPTFALLTQACMLMDASSSRPDASAPEPEPAVIPDKTDAGASE
jgi:hypothetical protein